MELGVNPKRTGHCKKRQSINCLFHKVRREKTVEIKSDTFLAYITGIGQKIKK